MNQTFILGLHVNFHGVYRFVSFRYPQTNANTKINPLKKGNFPWPCGPPNPLKAVFDLGHDEKK